ARVHEAQLAIQERRTDSGAGYQRLERGLRDPRGLRQIGYVRHAAPRKEGAGVAWPRRLSIRVSMARAPYRDSNDQVGRSMGTPRVSAHPRGEARGSRTLIRRSPRRLIGSGGCVYSSLQAPRRCLRRDAPAHHCTFTSFASRFWRDVARRTKYTPAAALWPW